MKKNVISVLILHKTGFSWAHPDSLIEVTDLLFSLCVFVCFLLLCASCASQFSVFLGLIFFLELTAGILAFVFKDWIKDQLNFFINNNVKAYRDDIDLQNLIDFAQEYVSPHLLNETLPVSLQQLMFLAQKKSLPSLKMLFICVSTLILNQLSSGQRED